MVVVSGVVGGAGAAVFLRVGVAFFAAGASAGLFFAAAALLVGVAFGVSSAGVVRAAAGGRVVFRTVVLRGGRGASSVALCDWSPS
ncbi:hypothetical protein [Micromonospora sp. DT233]|uniref:hypothetical protein n=1 Tax=Micromonospora sp. DT233 TaxID=3393432 RepID=UPI003CF603E4